MVGVWSHIFEDTGFNQTEWGKVWDRNLSCSMLGFPLLSSTWMDPSAAISSYGAMLASPTRIRRVCGSEEIKSSTL